jgi:hypothetical protein
MTKAMWGIPFVLALTEIGLAGSACRQKSGTEPEALASALSSDSVTLSVVLPPGADPASFVLLANGALTLDDRAIVSTPIVNMGNAGTRVGNDARTAAISSSSKVTILDRAVISNRIDTSVPIQASSSSRIAGPINVQATFTPPVVRTIAVNFPGSADVDVILPSGHVASPSPGRYRTITLSPGARLKLRSGTYYAETIDVEPQAILDLDEQHGPVVIYVKQPFIFRGSIATNTAGPNFLVGVTGSGVLDLESPFSGTIIAPSATLIFGTGSTTHTGAFFAQNIEVQPGVVIQFHASTAIPRCDDGNACTGRDILTGGVASAKIQSCSASRKAIRRLSSVRTAPLRLGAVRMIAMRN